MFRQPALLPSSCIYLNLLSLCDTTKSLHTKLSNYIQNQRWYKLIIPRAPILGPISKHIPINSITTCSFLPTTNPAESAAFLNSNFDTHFVTRPRSTTIYCWLPKDFWSVCLNLLNWHTEGTDNVDISVSQSRALLKSINSQCILSMNNAEYLSSSRSVTPAIHSDDSQQFCLHTELTSTADIG